MGEIFYLKGEGDKIIIEKLTKAVKPSLQPHSVFAEKIDRIIR